MPQGERHPHQPEWARQERLRDLAWLSEELPTLWTVAQAGYVAVGRGAVVIDTTEVIEDMGHPLAYFAQDSLSALGDRDAIRIVVTYEPEWQLVAMLLKTDNRVSTYRVGLPLAGLEQ